MQEVIDELFDFGEFSYQNIKKTVAKVLKENNCEAYACIVTSLSDEVQSLKPDFFQRRRLWALNVKGRHFIERTSIVCAKCTRTKLFI